VRVPMCGELRGAGVDGRKKRVLMMMVMIICLLGGILEESLGEELLCLEVGDNLVQEVDGDLGDVVDESEVLDDLLSVEGGGVVVEELLVEVRGEGRVDDAVLLAEIRPGLQVLLVGDISDGLHGQRGGERGLDGTHEVGLNAEERGDELVHGTLISIAGIAQVVNLLLGGLGGNEVQSLHHITDVHGVQAKTLVPKALHRLVELLVHSAHDQTGGNTSLVTRTIDDRGANNVVRHTRGNNLLLSLQRSLRQRSPGLQLGILLRRFLFMAKRGSVMRTRMRPKNERGREENGRRTFPAS